MNYAKFVINAVFLKLNDQFIRILIFGILEYIIKDRIFKFSRMFICTYLLLK